MPIREEFERQGNWLFRRRSVFPLLGAPLILVAFRHFSYPYGSHALDLMWEFFALGVSLLGVAIRIYTSGCAPRRTSGRSTKMGQVADSLNTSGMYSAVRHPLYLGNLLIALGPAIFPRVWWFALCYVALFWLYYERIIFAEEEFLRNRFGEAYLRWAGETPAFIPSFRNWRRADLPFSWRAALKKEYHSLFAVIVIFFTFELLGDTLEIGSMNLDPVWCALFAVGLAFFLVVHILRKTTRVLRIDGR